MYMGSLYMLYSRLFEAVFEHGAVELGPATAYAKSGLDSYHLDLHDTFVLLGDPAMDLNLTIVPWSQELYLPIALRGGLRSLSARDR